tara:strand:- start:6 stop:458 length:453 start_codon:yes stop_codon:yes gene_type:complete
MIFNLFKSKNEELNQHVKKTFEIYLGMLKSVPDDEVGYLLDTAAQIKKTTSLINEDVINILSNPASVDKKILIETLHLWLNHLLELHATQDIKQQAKGGALTVWYLSVGCVVFPEYKSQGIELWKELKRGFEHCIVFNPETDCIKGLEPD